MANDKSKEYFNEKCKKNFISLSFNEEFHNFWIFPSFFKVIVYFIENHIFLLFIICFL